MSQRKRSKVGRYDPKLMQALRAEITNIRIRCLEKCSRKIGSATAM